jgi:hypothetical protein
VPCSTGMARCHRACRHRAFVGEYRAARENDVQRAEEASNGWATEYQEYVRDNPLLTFHEWLKRMKGWGA